MRTLVLLPAYNEEQALPRLLVRMAVVRTGLPELEVLVVNDGSRDRTAQRVAEFAAGRSWVHLISHETNRGLGMGMRTGFAWALSNLADNDVVLAMDADNTHDPDLMPAMLTALRGHDVVIASRFAPGGEEVGLAPHRKLLSRGACWLMRICCPVPGVRDYSCGYRAYRVGALRRMSAYYPELVGSANFDCMAQILLQLATTGSRCREVGLVLRYDLKGGASKMRVWRTVKGYFRLVSRFASLLPHTPAAYFGPAPSGDLP